MLGFHNDTSKLLYYIKDYSTMKQCPNSKSECLWKDLHLSKESLLEARREKTTDFLTIFTSVMEFLEKNRAKRVILI